MSTLKLRSAYNFLTNAEWDWTIAQATATTIVLVNNNLSYRQTFTGSFTYDGLGGASGTVTSSTFINNGAVVYTVTGMEDLAAIIQGHAQTPGDAQETYAYVLRNSDVITGSAGADGLGGYAGNDVINGGAGADVMLGGSGNDTYIVDNVMDKAIETTTRSSGVDAGGVDTVKSSVTVLLNPFLEKLILTGTAAINGTGNTGNNVMLGNSAANILTGGTGADSLSGRGGDDTLVGGVGRDKLTGGAGADVFDFNSLPESGFTAATCDIINDFTSSVDKIDLSTIDANPFVDGNQAFAFLGEGGQAVWGVNGTGKLRYEVTEAGVTLFGSTDHDLAAEFSIFLSGVASLEAADILK